jgi:hypothetical protein
MGTPQEVSELVKRFDRNRESYRSSEYNETETTDYEERVVQRQIDTTDKQIDQLGHKLYALTDEDIRIIEEAAK